MSSGATSLPRGAQRRPGEISEAATREIEEAIPPGGGSRPTTRSTTLVNAAGAAGEPLDPGPLAAPGMKGVVANSESVQSPAADPLSSFRGACRYWSTLINVYCGP